MESVPPTQDFRQKSPATVVLQAQHFRFKKGYFPLSKKGGFADERNSWRQLEESQTMKSTFLKDLRRAFCHARLPPQSVPVVSRIIEFGPRRLLPGPGAYPMSTYNLYTKV